MTTIQDGSNVAGCDNPSTAGGLRTGLFAGLLMGFALGGTLSLGVWMGARWAVRPMVQFPVAEFPIPNIALTPVSATATDSFAAATGPVSEDVDGLFLLDYLTGELQCLALSRQTGTFTARFNINVFAHLGIDRSKRPNFLMLTGTVAFPRGTTPARPAESVVYVVDANTGHYAAYGIPWREEMYDRNMPQQGQLRFLQGGIARSAAIRD
ncbi:MAG: hypothetical protein R3E01_06365 [Pirellulaceae bacterium]|nr:hypothetical protein [Planctomycetales bacterium]